MSASETTIQSTFDEFFSETSAEVDFHFTSIVEGFDFFFTRIDQPLQDHQQLPRIPGFISFTDAIHLYSRWGNTLITFMLSSDEENLLSISYHPELNILPVVLAHMDKSDVIVRDTEIYFTTNKVKDVIKKIDAHSQKAIKSVFVETMKRCAS